VRLAAPYTRAGDYGLFWVALGCAVGPRRRTAVTVWGTLGVNYAVKRLVRRERPGVRAHVPLPASSSFPSSHAAMSAAAAIVLSRRHPSLTPVWIALAAAMAASRVVVGAHHASDVGAGVLLGTVTGAVLSGPR